MDSNNTYNELLKSIEHWNEYRVPILRISQPDKNLNFQGAMRFYFQDSGQKVATKCVNVTSANTTKDVIDVLIEKFRPDMRMLSVPEYGLYEIHENGDERKLSLDERPLFVQLGWNKDDREGRFLLRRMDEKTRDLASQNEEPSLKRKLSKKEKKKQEKIKKQQQKEQEKADAVANKLAAKSKNGIAERLYNELPETSFTRSISNPEAVMKRRRAQKLEKRLQEFSLEGGQEAGGTLRIFGETINKDVSYKTLLLSTRDTASFVVKQILEKYGKENEDPTNYCLVQLIVPPSATSALGDNNSVHDLNTSSTLRECILDDQDCPLLINQNHDKSKGILTFHIRHKPADYQKRRKKKPSRAQVQQNPLHPLVVQQLNQRLQINNNSEQYSNQNSPQNSSQTSGSINHDANHPPPPPFETIHSMPRMFPASNDNMIPYLQQQHAVSADTLPSRMNSHNVNSNIHLQQDVNGTVHRQNYNQLNHHSMTNQQNNQMSQSQMVPNNHFLIGQQQIQTPYMQVPCANDQILPALIQVKEDVEDLFLNTVITHMKPTDTAFRLAPTYVLYMVSRYRASTLFHPELQAPSRAELFVPFTKKIASMIRNTIEAHKRDPAFLAFWLANSSDLSHFYKQDKHLSHFTIDAQEILYDSIKASFKYLLACKQLELDTVLDSFFDERDDQIDQIDPATSRLTMNPGNPPVNVLNDTMATMRKNRVNAALTIQIFSHLFHHISKWLFDRLIGVYDKQANLMNGQRNYVVYCNRIWGERLHRRLSMIGDWAEKQGLEQAAEFHLAHVTQVTIFLSRRYSNRITPHDFKEACDSCDRLNPIQLRALIQRYQPESSAVRAMIDNFLFTMDYSYRGGEYPLEEDFELKIPFLIPDDGYSSEMIRYIPNGLLEFVSYLSNIQVRDQKLCIFTVQPTSSGFWTVYFKNHQSDMPEIIVIQLRKKNNSMGLSIIAARGVGQERLGIYIKNVVKNGAAAMDGRLQAGDQLLEVDGNSLLDITQETAAEFMQRTGPVVTLRIAKQAAIYHNLSDVINSVPTVLSPQSVLPPNFVPAPLEPIQQIPLPERKLLPPPQSHPPIHPIERHHSQSLRPSQPELDPRLVQFQQPDRHIQHLPPSDRLNAIQAEKVPQVIPERQVHFQPPPPSMLFDDQPSPNLVNATSPLKSPKKVSWVDTQPHQSLHTLIPPSPALNPSPNAQISSQPPEIPSPPSQLDETFPVTDNEHHNYLHDYYNNNGHHDDVHEMINGKVRAIEEEDDDDNDDDDVDDDDDDSVKQENHLHIQLNGQLPAEHNQIDKSRDVSDTNRSNTNGQQLDTTTESLTLEDIDEVLSSKTDNNWLEDSAGVIGTQEVYNDPRQRIVKERERSNADVNIEKLSFQDKLKMFNLSAKK